ncbi:HemD protein, partial [Bacillus cereus]|nr:HemD protein [Bacillus cereus]
DARLITVKGWECIQLGDVIVYDRLASPRLLGLMKPGAQKIYVGKLPDRHTMKQEEINQLLVDLALEGKTVVRLKGGDPP